MKKNILLLLFVITSYGYAQYPIINDSVKLSGLYRTFEEFRDNKPSIIINFINSTYKIEKEERKYGNIGNRKFIYAYGLNCDQRTSENIGSIFGFCDGNKIYITSETQQFPHYMSFYEINYLNTYSYFDFVSTDYLNSISLESLSCEVIDLKTGKFSKLTKSFIKKIILNNSELSRKFELQDEKSKHLKEYLIEYLKK